MQPQNHGRSALASTSIGRSLLGALGLVLTLQPAAAQSPQPALELPPTTPPEVRALLQAPTGELVSTAQTPSQSGFTVPSLWWTEEQFGNRVVSTWAAYAGDRGVGRRVDLFVRPELWGRYNLWQRYSLVSHFGSVASDYGYHLLVFDRQIALVGAYTCNFAQVSPSYVPGLVDVQGQPVPDYTTAKSNRTLACQIWLNPVYPTVLPPLSDAF